jgi:anti-sigma regulatory factor (Ser/Thr protein kinase)
MKSFAIHADKYSQKSIRDLLDKALFNIEASKLDDIKIACSEVVQNIVRHGYQFEPDRSINVVIEKLENKIQITFEDSAKPCDPSLFMDEKVKPGELGLMGIPIIKKLTYNFEITPLIAGNLTKLTFKL